MAKCLNCGCIYSVYGGSKGTKCPKCKSKNIDISKERR
jgi:predicted Zn-ribbon and HTH transcriptional regulator